MVSLLKRLFPIPMVFHRVIIFLLLTFVGLISAFGIQFLSPERVIGVKPQTDKLICSTTNSPEQLSGQGRTSYEQGRFDEAIDCWQKAVATYRKLGNENEAINNQINQAQAEQVLGLYPRACNTLVRIYGEADCTTLLKDEQKEKQFREALQKLADTPAKITGLRILGNVFRGLGELNWSYQTLISLVNLSNLQPQQGQVIWLDLANTIRALSNREQDFYNRSQEQENVTCAFTYADVANNVYQKASDYTNQDSQSVIKLQAQLNQLSLVLDLRDWSNKIKQDTKGKEDIFKQGTNISSFQRRRCFLKLATSTQTGQSGMSKLQLNDENINGLFQQLPSQSLLIQSQEVENIQQQIDRLPPSHTEISIRLNFAKSLIRFQDLPEPKVKEFLQTTINQAHKLGDLRAESYGFGYLGKLYEDRKKWDLAKNNTQQAWFLAQSIPAPDIEYQWEWQLGRIYKPQATQREKGQTKGIQEEGKDLKQGREMYKRAFQTLQSLRTELVAGNPDGQIFFQNDIEGIYREYVDLLLWDKQPAQEDLSQAREVIASLQAVELENFLRVACPEYNLEQIDEIINKQAQKAAFLYPIVLDDRVEVILKLPTNSTQKNSVQKDLKHYRTLIDRAKVETQIKKLQLDLEEEYTFDDVQREAKEVYGWLVEGAEKYLSKDIDTLVFALDTNLRNIPLAALVDNVAPNGKPQYLVDKYAIALAPRLEIPTPRLLQGKTLKILAAGLSESKEYQQQFPRLRFVTEELNAIKEVGKSKISVSQLVNEQFKVNRLKDQINSDIFQVLHLATHGEFSSSPEKTFILASDQPIKANDIDNVFRKQAQNQPEPIELLVLSACETAAGDQRATLGISGVAVRAGARSAIASLWTLDDEISVEFTKEFYKELVNPQLTKAQALRKAQIELKNSPGREHPRYWASYILVGNWL